MRSKLISQNRFYACGRAFCGLRQGGRFFLLRSSKERMAAMARGAPQKNKRDAEKWDAAMAHTNVRRCC